jgi:hypothetical protein
VTWCTSPLAVSVSHQRLRQHHEVLLLRAAQCWTRQCMLAPGPTQCGWSHPVWLVPLSVAGESSAACRTLEKHCGCGTYCWGAGVCTQWQEVCLAHCTRQHAWPQAASGYGPGRRGPAWSWALVTLVHCTAVWLAVSQSGCSHGCMPKGAGAKPQASMADVAIRNQAGRLCSARWGKCRCCCLVLPELGRDCGWQRSAVTWPHGTMGYA